MSDEFSDLPTDPIERATYISIYAAAYAMAATEHDRAGTHCHVPTERAVAKRVADEWLYSAQHETLGKLDRRWI